LAHPNLVGMWKLTSIIYRSQPMPLPNPDLKLYFMFFSNGDSWLRWFRVDEQGFCERRAQYLVFEDWLYQKTIWLNPHNATSCSNDPEMRMSSETYTEFKIDKNNLFMSLDLSDEKIIYVFTLLPEESEEIGKEIIKRVKGL
jgi:hypothetical protein